MGLIRQQQVKRAGLSHTGLSTWTEGFRVVQDKDVEGFKDRQNSWMTSKVDLHSQVRLQVKC